MALRALRRAVHVGEGRSEEMVAMGSSWGYPGSHPIGHHPVTRGSSRGYPGSHPPEGGRRREKERREGDEERENGVERNPGRLSRKRGGWRSS